VKKETKGVVTGRAVPGPALYQITVMPDAPKAIVGVLHGYADYGERYLDVMRAWADMGIGSVALDMRGHGHAEGARGYCDRFDEFLDDATELLRLTSDAAKGVPQFLFGHSFGGLVAASSVLRDAGDVKGLLLSNPYFELALEVGAPKLFAARAASRLYPKLALPSGLMGKDLTHDKVIAAKYDADPLVFKKATARWFVESTKAQARLFEDAPRLALPLYMLLGSADPVASPKGGRRFHELAGSKDKTLDVREGLYHEVLNEPEWPELAKALGDWVLAHAAK
jgi:alpha-beta hydrolase superfamily lysophospholipase